MFLILSDAGSLPAPSDPSVCFIQWFLSHALRAGASRQLLELEPHQSHVPHIRELEFHTALPQVLHCDAEVCMLWWCENTSKMMFSGHHFRYIETIDLICLYLPSTLIMHINEMYLFNDRWEYWNQLFQVRCNLTKALWALKQETRAASICAF